MEKSTGKFRIFCLPNIFRLSKVDRFGDAHRRGRNVSALFALDHLDCSRCDQHQVHAGMWDHILGHDHGQLWQSDA